MGNIHNALATRFDKSSSEVRAAVRAEDVRVVIEQWGKVRRVDTTEGDTMRAADFDTQIEDTRDASWIRVSTSLISRAPGTYSEHKYEVLVDKNARNSKTPEFRQVARYGQLQQIFRICFETPCPALGIHEPENIIFAAIRSCKLDRDDPVLGSLDIHFYSSTSELDIVDLDCVECLVGRVAVGGRSWAIFDRSGDLVRATWAED